MHKLNNFFIRRQVDALHEAERTLIDLRAQACVAALCFIEGDVEAIHGLDQLDRQLDHTQRRVETLRDALRRLGLTDGELPQLRQGERARLFAEYLHACRGASGAARELLSDADIQALVDDLAAMDLTARTLVAR